MKSEWNYTVTLQTSKYFSKLGRLKKPRGNAVKLKVERRDKRPHQSIPCHSRSVSRGKCAYGLCGVHGLAWDMAHSSLSLSKFNISSMDKGCSTLLYFSTAKGLPPLFMQTGVQRKGTSGGNVPSRNWEELCALSAWKWTPTAEIKRPRSVRHQDLSCPSLLVQSRAYG